MSVVTNVILTFSISENTERVLIELKNFKYNGITPFNIVSIKDKSLPHAWYGGSKMMESNVCLGAYNNLDLKGLIHFLHKIDWEFPESVQLMVKEQDDIIFRLFNLSA